jgi:hypothetical protein
MYQTKSQAWNEVMSHALKLERIQAICKEVYNTENMKGYTDEQRAHVYETYVKQFK